MGEGWDHRNICAWPCKISLFPDSVSSVYGIYSDAAHLSVSCIKIKTMSVSEVVCNLTERCRRVSAFYTSVSNRSELVKLSRGKMHQACRQAPDSLGTQRTH